MYSACRSRLATERHLSHATALVYAVPLCQNVKEHYQAAVRNTPPYYRVFALLREKEESNPPLIVTVTCPLLRLRVFFSQVPLLFRGDARLSVLSALSVHIFVQGLLREG